MSTRVLWVIAKGGASFFGAPDTVASVVALNGRIMAAGPLDAGAAAVATLLPDLDVAAVVSTLALDGPCPAPLRRVTSVSPHLDIVCCGPAATVYPGFVDSHVHLFDAGRREQAVKLRSVSSREEFRRVVADAVAERKRSDDAETGAQSTTQWLLGGDWDESRFGGELPTREWIDDLTGPQLPALFTRFDCHTALANTAAFRSAGIDPDASGAIEAVAGGVIDLDSVTGRATGIVRERAISRLKQGFPSSDEESNLLAALRVAEDELLANGITGVHTMTSLDYGNLGELHMLHRLASAGQLRIRVAGAVRPKELDRAVEELKPLDSDWVRLLGVKVFLDGSLGSRTAAFYEPFLDRGGAGVTMMSALEVRDVMQRCTVNGVMLMAHAIGDRAVGTVLDAVEACGDTAPPMVRIEHCQHVCDADLQRMAALAGRGVKIVASMQPTHGHSDRHVVTAALGEERARQTYRYRSLKDASCTLAFGSDWMVMPPRPLDSITVATQPPEPFVERLCFAEAVEAFTSGPAIAAGWDSSFGSIDVGKCADLTITVASPDHQHGAEVVCTIVDGVVRYIATV